MDTMNTGINFGYVGYRDAGLYGKNNTNGNDGRIGSFWEGVRGYSPTARGILVVSDSGEGVRGTHQNSGNTGVLGHSLYGIYAQSALAGVYAECTNGNVGYIGGVGTRCLRGGGKRQLPRRLGLPEK